MSTLLQTDYVGISPANKLAYVIIGRREKFDAIPLPETVHDNGCHSKATGDFEEMRVIFQWWPEADASVANAGVAAALAAKGESA